MASDLIHLMGRVFNTPLYITEDKLDVILGVLLPKLSGEALSVPKAEAAKTAEKTTLSSDSGAIGVINIFGTLVHRSSWLDSMSGMISYGAVRDAFRGMMADPDISGVIFRMDSNGGEGAGLFDLVDEIYEARGKKPIHAFVDERSFSACYALASACDTIGLTRTAGAGSIGVIAQHVDRSEMNKKDGIKMTPIFAGARKNDFSPHEPLSNEAHASLKAMVDEGYGLFAKTVARNRNMDEKTVRATEAGLFWGEAAIKAGLADSIQTWDQAVEAVSNQIRSRRKGGTQMSKDVLVKQLTALMQGDGPETWQAAMDGLGYCKAQTAEESAATKAASDVALAKAKQDGAAEAMAKVHEVIDLCTLGEMPQMAGQLIKAGLSVEEARSAVVNAKAAAAADGIKSTVGAGAGEQVNYLIKDAEQRAGK